MLQNTLNYSDRQIFYSNVRDCVTSVRCALFILEQGGHGVETLLDVLQLIHDVMIIRNIHLIRFYEIRRNLSAVILNVNTATTISFTAIDRITRALAELPNRVPNIADTRCDPLFDLFVEIFRRVLTQRYTPHLSSQCHS